MTDNLADPFDMPDEAPEAQPAPEAAAPPAEPAPAPQPAPVAAGTGETKAAPPAAGEDRAGMIPIAALMDERLKRQAIEQREAELRRQIESSEAQKAQQPGPDLFADPDAFIAAQRAQMAQALWNERLNMSEMVVREAYKATPQVVDEAVEAFKAEAARNPVLGAELQRQRNPYGYVVEWHQRQKALAEIGDDPRSYREKLAAEIRAQVLAEIQQAAPVQPARPPMPPRSLASAPSAGGNVNAPKSGFEAEFG